MKSLEVSEAEEVVLPHRLVNLTQEQCEQLRGDTPCARCSCQLRGHVWGWGTVGCCRLHGDYCANFVIDQSFEKLRDSQPVG
jgi:hypothetical protein